jgi:hypothetical protein
MHVIPKGDRLSSVCNLFKSLCKKQGIAVLLSAFSACEIRSVDSIFKTLKLLAKGH